MRAFVFRNWPAQGVLYEYEMWTRRVAASEM